MHGNPGKASEVRIERRWRPRKERQGLAEASRRGNRRHGIFGALKPAKMTEKQRGACRAIANSGRILILAS
jgi:hypothetical protein